MRRRGFTLIELLVVIAIIAVLIALLAAGRPGRPRGRPALPVRQQPQADRPGDRELRKLPRLTPLGGRALRAEHVPLEPPPDAAAARAGDALQRLQLLLAHQQRPLEHPERLQLDRPVDDRERLHLPVRYQSAQHVDQRVPDRQPRAQ